MILNRIDRHISQEIGMNPHDYGRAVEATRSVVASVRTSDMPKPTPCGSWTVRDLIIHMIDAPIFTTALMETGDWHKHVQIPFDPATGDFVSAYDAATTRLISVFSAEADMSRTRILPIIGETTIPGILVLSCCDAFVHGWDVAKAIGLPSDLDNQLAESILEAMRTMVTEKMRGQEGESLFGPEAVVPPNASPADRLAAFLGREP